MPTSPDTDKHNHVPPHVRITELQDPLGGREGVVYPDVRLSVIIPACAELGNGQLLHLLHTIALTDSQQIGVVVVVNNTEPQNDKQHTAYSENQLTLRLLHALQDYTDEGFQEVQEIWALYCTNTLKQPNTQAHLRVLQLIHRSQIPLVVVDASSPKNWFDRRNVGRARGIGLDTTFLYAFPNAQLAHFADADTMYSQEFVESILHKISLYKPDVVVMPYHVIPRTIPEQVRSGTSPLERLSYIVQFYEGLFFSNIEGYATYGDHALGGSQVAVSRKVYENMRYPDGAVQADFMFAGALLKSEDLYILWAHYPDLAIELCNRYRDGSIDGRLAFFIDTLNSIESIERYVRGSEFNYARSALQKLAECKNRPNTNTYRLEELLLMTQKKIGEDRQLVLRYAKVVIQKISQYNSPIPQNKRSDLLASFPPRVQRFFADNHCLLDVFLDIFGQENIHSEQEMWTFLQTLLPSFFSKPCALITKLDKYEEYLKHLETSHALPEGICYRDLSHINLALALL